MRTTRRTGSERASITCTSGTGVIGLATSVDVAFGVGSAPGGGNKSNDDKSTGVCSCLFFKIMKLFFFFLFWWMINKKNKLFWLVLIVLRMHDAVDDDAVHLTFVQTHATNSNVSSPTRRRSKTCVYSQYSKTKT